MPKVYLVVKLTNCVCVYVFFFFLSFFFTQAEALFQLLVDMLDLAI